MPSSMIDSFGSHATLTVQGRTHKIARLAAVERAGFALARLPYSLRVLLESLLRLEDGAVYRRADIEAVAGWKPRAGAARPEISFMPARVLLQDFTGVPCVVDLASMRDAMRALGGDPRRINPLQPVELVIDHSVQVDSFGTPAALGENAAIEFQRNGERYAFLRWGQQAFENFKAVPPSTGIVHQVNLEHLARVVIADEAGARGWACFDTLVGTDSHTTMVNGLGVLGWGVGGIEAEAAMLGQPVTMLVPDVVGVRLSGRLAEGATATDLVLSVTQLLRKHGVVGKFVEFFGPGLPELSLADRATIANMAPEYGATCGYFPIDAQTIAYLRFTGRPAERCALVEAYARAQGVFVEAGTPEPEYTDLLALDLASVEPCLAGPKRPQDRLALAAVKPDFAHSFAQRLGDRAKPARVPIDVRGASAELGHGSVVIAAITSCTNTSNPAVLVAAGLVAKKANERGLAVKPWVKTSLAPGSRVVTEYLRESGLLAELEKQRFHVVGYGCTTCIGNSGPLPEPVSKAIESGDLVAAAVLSGNRNFEGRVHAQVRANYLASPPLVVAYALAGRVDFEPTTEPLGAGRDGKPVYLRDVWPSNAEVMAVMQRAVKPEQFARTYAEVYRGDTAWQAIRVPRGDTYEWDERSTYVKRAPYFDGMPKEPRPVADVAGARCLALLGDSITTDHISPAGSIKAAGPAGAYLQGQGVAPADFNQYGARRGNHEVMARGTFANVRLRNLLVPGVEGGVTRFLGSGPQAGKTLAIYDAALEYQKQGTPLVVLAGSEYGSGSSRDWAAKGVLLLGVRAVIARSFERIHRSNLIGMGVLPLEFPAGQSAQSLGLGGDERFDVRGLAALYASTPWRAGRKVEVVAAGAAGKTTRFEAALRIDTPNEAEYFRHGGILQYVLRKLVAGK
jgi:aconitate hydratase